MRSLDWRGSLEILFGNREPQYQMMIIYQQIIIILSSIQETERIDSRFLEPACGDGNFLIEILKRKLNIVKKKYKKSIYDYERFSLLAISSLYGVELLEDNVVACRKRLYDYWQSEYKIVSKKLN